MYKTAVYTLVNGDITHQQQQISEKSDITLTQNISPKCQCNAEEYHLFLIFAVFDV